MEEKPNQDPIANNADQSGCCGPGCQCGGGGVGAKGKMLICMLFLVAAGVVLACSIYRKAHTQQAAQPQAFATTVPAQLAAAPIAQPKVAEPVKAAAWGEPLKDLASLSQRASNNDAVLLYIPEKSQGAVESVKQLLEQTATKAKAGGANTAYFALDTNSADYSNITTQVKAPCVLAMVKGGAVVPVTGDLTEGKLLQAIVAASRPSSGCGPSGCGPAGSASSCGPTGATSCAPVPPQPAAK